MLQASGRLTECTLEMFLILGDAVGNGFLEIGPNKFIRVQFWRIAWEEISVDSAMSLEISFDDISLMNLVVVPYDDNLASKVPLEVGDKLGHFRLADVLIGVECNIEPQSLSLGRNADAADGR